MKAIVNILAIYILSLILMSNIAYSKPVASGICNLLHISRAVRKVVPTHKLPVADAITVVRKEMASSKYVADLDGDWLDIPKPNDIKGDCEDLTAYSLVRLRELGVPLNQLGFVILKLEQEKRKQGEQARGHILPIFRFSDSDWYVAEATDGKLQIYGSWRLIVKSVGSAMSMRNSSVILTLAIFVKGFEMDNIVESYFYDYNIKSIDFEFMELYMVMRIMNHMPRCKEER